MYRPHREGATVAREDTRSVGDSPPQSETPVAQTRIELASDADNNHGISVDRDSQVCFVCTRCEYPICTSADLILSPVDQGTTENAFHYNLDCLLDLDDREVPCYSGDEAVDIAVSVSEKLLDIPLPPAARALAVESIVESRKCRKEQRHAMMCRLQHRRTLAGNGGEPVIDEEPEAPPSPSASSSSPPHASGRNGDAATGLDRDQWVTQSGSTEGETPLLGGELPNTAAARQDSWTIPTVQDVEALRHQRIRPMRRYGMTSESRVDLVCVRESVLGHGLTLSTLDRSAESAVIGEKSMQTLQQVPAAVLEAVCKSPPATQWESPGNFSVEEAFITVSRATTSSKGQWFAAFQCTKRAQCPDCHLALGFLFHRCEQPLDEVSTRRGLLSEKSCRADTAEAGSIEPHSKKTKTDDGSAHATTAGEGAVDCSREVEESVHGGSALVCPPATPQGVSSTLITAQAGPAAAAAAADEEARVRAGMGDSAFPNSFVGLELKCIKQREWGLREFQERYSKAARIDTFRALFPEAEELQSLYNRLTALRTQSELFNNLLQKHKEQNDVQSAFLHSQKDRMATYEEKLKTMEQIIDAQRTQLLMQSKQLQHQEELMVSHRHQVCTQQQQIDVGQLLISEQNKTIESQREQIRLMKAHLNAKYMQEKLTQQRHEIERKLRDRREALAQRVVTTATEHPVPEEQASQREAMVDSLPEEAEFLHSHAQNAGSVAPLHLRGIYAQNTGSYPHADCVASLGSASMGTKPTSASTAPQTAGKHGDDASTIAFPHSGEECRD